MKDLKLELALLARKLGLVMASKMGKMLVVLLLAKP